MRLPGFGGAWFLGVSVVALGAAGGAWCALYPGLPQDLGGAANLDARAEHARIAVAPGDSLDGWYLPSRNGAHVLLLHGYGRTHTHVWRYAGFLQRAGYGVLAVDFRSSRAHGRAPTTLGHYELPDARAALGWLRARADGGPIGVLGESLGGSVALALAAENPDLRAVIADCAFASGRLAIEESCERWLHVPRWPLAGMARLLGVMVTGCDPMALDAVAAARALRGRPLLLIACDRDDRFSPAQTESLARAAATVEPPWIVAGAGHNEAWVRHPEEYERRVLGFLGRQLLGATAARAAAPSPPKAGRRRA